MRSHNPRLATVYALCASFFFALGSLFVKTLSHELSLGVMVFFRFVFSLLFFSAVLPFRMDAMQGMKTKAIPLLLLRTFSGVASMFCLYYAIQYLPLSEALILSFTRPLFIPILVYFWFKKPWTSMTLIGLLIGFIGVALVIKPTTLHFSIPMLVGLGGGLFGAVVLTTIRRLTRTEPADRIVFYFFLLAIPITFFPMITAWTTPTLKEFGILLLIGLFSMVYQMLLARAYRHAKAVQVSSLLYFSVVFGMLFDFFLADQTIDMLSLLGVACIIGGSFFLMKEQASKA